MNLKTFFEHFDTLAEAPNGIQRLRELILDMAVRGKLVTQDPEDEPAHKLLKLQKIDESDPHSEEIPESWAWARFDQFLGIRGGSQPPKSTFSSIPEDGYIRLLQIRDFGENPVPVYIPKDRAKRTCNEADVMLARYGASIGKVFMGQEGAYNVALTKILFNKNKFFNRYIFYLLKSSLFQKHLINASRSAQAGFNKGDLQKVFLPVAPLAEQKRIVAKVDELMALCDALEAAQQTRNTLRQKMRASALDGLMNAPSNTDLETAWAFVRDNWGLMCDQPEDVEDLRQVIFQQAVEGKLSCFDSNDEDAAFIVERALRTRKKLEDRKKITRRKEQDPVEDDELALDLPHKWTYIRFGEIADIVSGVTKGRKLSGRDTAWYPYLRVANVQRWMLDLNVLKEIEIPIEELDKYQLQTGDILLTEGGDWEKLGRSTIWRGELEVCIHQNHVFRARLLDDGILPDWVVLFTNSYVGRRYFEGAAKRTTNLASINMTQLRFCPLPLPPKEEQKRIVAKVDELMKLCDQLEASLRQQQETAQALAASALCLLGSVR